MPIVTVRNTASLSENWSRSAARASSGGGAVSRRPHPVHGRIQQIAVTEAGDRLLAEAKQRMQGLEAALAQALSPGEERVLRRWLVQVATAAGG